MLVTTAIIMLHATSIAIIVSARGFSLFAHAENKVAR